MDRNPWVAVMSAELRAGVEGTLAEVRAALVASGGRLAGPEGAAARLGVPLRTLQRWRKTVPRVEVLVRLAREAAEVEAAVEAAVEA